MTPKRVQVDGVWTRATNETTPMPGRARSASPHRTRGGGLADPDHESEMGETIARSTLPELSQFQLQYELKNNEAGRLTKQRAVDLFKSSMDQDYPAMEDRKARSESPTKRPRGGQGYPPLETAMRSVYREALRIRKPVHREPTNEELELAECTFHPAINRPPEKSASGGPAQPRSRTAIFAGTQSRSMSTRDMQEIVELQECTFTPNLYKHL